ncbi:MAG TPA: MFS transporter [Nitrososphaerales archaeon]|nr:MFS transporter [Nitrososphaerales archaeon]
MTSSSGTSKTRYSNFTVVWSSQTTAAILIFTVPALAPLLVAKDALTATQIGALTSIMYVGICGVSVFISVISDSLGVKRILIAGHVIEAVSVISASVAHNFAGFAISIFGVGIGYSSITPVTSKAIMSWFSKENRSATMGLKQTGTTVGGTIAGAALPLIGVTYGLGAAFIAAGLLVLSGAGIVLAYRESDQFTGTTKISMAFLRRGVSISRKNRNLLWLGGVGFFYAAVQAVVVTYITLFSHSVLGFTPVIAGLFLSLVNISGTVGRPVYGAVSDRIFKGSRIKDLYLISLTSFVMLLLLSELRSTTDIWVVVPVMALLGFGALGWNGVFLTLAGEYSDSGYEGVGTSLSFSIAMTGQIVGAPIYGMIIQTTGSYFLGWQVFAIALILAATIFAVVRRNYDPGKIPQLVARGD